MGSSSTSSDVTNTSNNINSFGAITKASDHVQIESCHDTINNNIQLEITYTNLKTSENKLPWVGLAFRTNEECTMFPKNGNDKNGTESILMFQNDNNNGLIPYQYYITRDTMSIASPSSTTESSSYKSIPLSNITSTYSNIKVYSNQENDSVTLSFIKNDIPMNAMHLTYAIGTSNQFGYHNERTCFTVNSYPPCSASNSNIEVNNVYTTKSSAFSIYDHSTIASSCVSVVVFSMFLCLYLNKKQHICVLYGDDIPFFVTVVFLKFSATRYCYDAV